MKTVTLESLNALVASPLSELDAAELLVARRSEDLRGRALRDSRGRRLGKIDALYIDEREKRVRFIRFAAGGLFGLGARRYLIPVDAIRCVDEADVYVELSAKHVFEGPLHDAKRGEEPSSLRALYAYYGYAPFWTMGYRYPAFPYYPASNRAGRQLTRGAPEQPSMGARPRKSDLPA